MNSKPLLYAADDRTQSLLGPMGISVAIHLLMVGLLLYSPRLWTPDPQYLPSVIDVEMVEVSDLNPAPVQKETMPKEKTTEKAEEKPVETEPQPEKKVEPAKEAEISVAPPPKKKTSKKALKYKTFKQNKVLKNALKRVEKKVESTPPKPLEDTLKKLREKVAKEGRPQSAGTNSKKGEKINNSNTFGRGSQKEIELIDLYRVDVALIIEKNWAFAEQLSGGAIKSKAVIAFKVMPDGTIDDIFFTDRSGNQYLDDSAYRAIVKSSPVKPHPEKLSVPYVEMGLRFGPEGIQ